MAPIARPPARRWLALAGLLVPLLAAAAGPTRAQAVWPEAAFQASKPARQGVNNATLRRGTGYAIPFGGSGVVLRNGYRVAYWGDQAAAYPLFSSTKSLGSILLGLAVGDGRVRLDQPARSVLPDLGVPPDTNEPTGWPPLITVEQLATHTAGFAKPGGFEPLLFRPGTAWSYSDGGANWLADALTTAYGRDLSAVLSERVLAPLQISTTDLTWRRNLYRPRTLGAVERREFGAGITANVSAMARIGLMMARGGRWKERQILPPGYAARAGSTPRSIMNLPLQDPRAYPGAPQHYGLLWWNNGDGAIPGLPTDAFWAWGLTDSIILVVPSLDLVVARAGPAIRRAWGNLDTLRPFFTPVGLSVTRANAAPVVDVGPDLAATTGQPASLTAAVREDGLPGARPLAFAWSVRSGPGTATFSTSGRLATLATFPAAGAYVVRLRADDGAVSGLDELTVSVSDPAPPPPPPAGPRRGRRAGETTGPGAL